MARQFDLYRMAEGQNVMVLQADLLDDLSTRLVAPLMPAGQGVEMRGLTVRVDIGSEPFVLMPHLMATLTLAELGEHVGNASALRERIVGALDLAFTGV